MHVLIGAVVCWAAAATGHVLAQKRKRAMSDDDKVQTRSDGGELLLFDDIRAALAHAERDRTVWKISFNAANGDRIRLIRYGVGWMLELLELPIPIVRP